MPSPTSCTRSRLLVALAAAGGAGCADATPEPTAAAAPSAAAAEEWYRAALSPREMVPAAASDASGEAILTITGGRRIEVRLSASNLAGVTEAHAHAGRPGELGPRLLDVFRTLPGWNPTVNGPLVVTTLERDGMPDPARLDELARHVRAGTAYVIVRTLRYPDGEIRGQLARAAR